MRSTQTIQRRGPHRIVTEWCVVAIVLSLGFPPAAAHSAEAQCSARCAQCARDLVSLLDGSFSALTCTLECEGILSSVSELDKCQTFLEYIAGLQELSERNELEPSRSEMEDALGTSVGAIVKRYGGFFKKVLKKERSLFPEDAHLKGLLTKKSRNSSSKFGEIDIPNGEQESDSSENESAVYDDDAAINEVKRYGGFFRKYNGRRSSVPQEESNPEELQKRYGGFMRRIRPQKFINQKRYGRFLEHNFKISVRSDEDPGSYDGFDR
ncbi:proenkephalin-B-like [Scleropages formosus]|uniref:Proenkephalin-B-like n=1 Tax=Scleropages formosus TaxID=113540 RepID=A0A8C9SB42_SCLFO|nr:proenkephalin-B-like [Scleropages formosus]